MKAPASEGRSWMGRRIRCAVQGLRTATAALGVTAVVCPVRKNCRRAWANRLESGTLRFRGTIHVSTNNLSPKEATAMSRDIKYIGMDVHKEAIVIDCNRRPKCAVGS